MPVMDGIEATKEIRRMEKLNGAGGFPSTPQSEGQRTPSEASVTDSRSSTMSTPPYRSSVIIVALTASSLQSDRVAALAAGCNDFLTKPVSLHWLNSKIIEWGSIKALQMWADIRPDVVKSISSGQAAQAQNVARRLHVPEGRTTPTVSRSRSSSINRKTNVREGVSMMAKGLFGEDKIDMLNPVHIEFPGPSSSASPPSVVAERKCFVCYRRNQGLIDNLLDAVRCCALCRIGRIERHSLFRKRARWDPSGHLYVTYSFRNGSYCHAN